MSPEQAVAIVVLVLFLALVGVLGWREAHWTDVEPFASVEAPDAVVAPLPEPIAPVELPPAGVVSVSRPGEVRLVFYDVWNIAVGEEWINRFARRPTVKWTAPDGASEVSGTTGLYMASREDDEGAWHYRWVERCR